MERKFAAIVVEGRVEFVRPHGSRSDRPPSRPSFSAFPVTVAITGEYTAQLLRIKVRDDFIEDFAVPYCTAPMTLSTHHW